jgi:hypothetical protein
MRQWLQWLRTGVLVTSHMSMLPLELYSGAAPFGALYQLFYAALGYCFYIAAKQKARPADVQDRIESKRPASGSLAVFACLGLAATITITGPYGIATAPTATLLAVRTIAWMPFGAAIGALFKLLDPRIEYAPPVPAAAEAEAKQQ